MKQNPLRHTRTHLFFSLFLLFLVSRSLVGGEPGFDLTATEKDFSLYFPAYLANGFFTTSSSLRGTDATLSFMAGVMDYTPGDVSRPAAIPSWAETNYFDGSAWVNATPVTANAFRDYRQTLHMYDGVLSTQYIFASRDRSTQVAVSTFASEDETHVGVTRLSLTPDFTGLIRLSFTLRPHPAPVHRLALARLTREELAKTLAEVGPRPQSIDSAGRPSSMPLSPLAEIGPRPQSIDPTANSRANEWYPGYVEIQAFGGNESERLIWITGRGVGGPQVAEAAAVELSPGVTPTEVKLVKSAEVVCLDLALKVERGRTYNFTKYVAVSRDGWGGLDSAVIGWSKQARREGFISLLVKHQSAWHHLWRSDIRVESDPEVQQVIHSALFALLENSTANTAWGMGGCGFSPNYLYHVFWDNDSWDFPALILFQPERAKSLEMFRYRTLPQAEARAKEHGYRGAMYPWQADPQTGEEAGSRSALMFADREIHVNADIAIAQWEYYLATGDTAWLRDYGYRVIRETAQFWTSRVTYNREKDRYEIFHVTSPEENYNDVPNNSFTNAVAQKALRVAVAAAVIVGQPPDPQWSEIAQKMYIPFSEKEQHHLDFDPTVPHNLKTWMGSSISWLSYPPLDLPMSDEIRRNDFNFAVNCLHELTPDANDMVPTMLGIEAAELGDGSRAYEWLKFSLAGFLKPPFNITSETPKNNNLYILATTSGFLENFLYGFTGLRFTDQGLTPVYAPVLPPAWKRVTIKNVKLHGQSFDFILSRDEVGKVHLDKRPAAS
jgi:trehalose/maltose hydrolase-like predicted phosphorylase